MKYAEMENIESGVRVRSPSGLVVETTGNTQHIEAVGVYVHEVVIVEGANEGEKFLLNLDSTQPL